MAVGNEKDFGFDPRKIEVLIRSDSKPTVRKVDPDGFNPRLIDTLLANTSIPKQEKVAALPIERKEQTAEDLGFNPKLIDEIITQSEKPEPKGASGSWDEKPVSIEAGYQAETAAFKKFIGMDPSKGRYKLPNGAYFNELPPQYTGNERLDRSAFINTIVRDIAIDTKTGLSEMDKRAKQFNWSPERLRDEKSKAMYDLEEKIKAGPSPDNVEYLGGVVRENLKISFPVIDEAVETAGKVYAPIAKKIPLPPTDVQKYVMKMNRWIPQDYHGIPLPGGGVKKSYSTLGLDGDVLSETIYNHNIMAYREGMWKAEQNLNQWIDNKIATGTTDEKMKALLIKDLVDSPIAKGVKTTLEAANTVVQSTVAAAVETVVDPVTSLEGTLDTAIILATFGAAHRGAAKIAAGIAEKQASLIANIPDEVIAVFKESPISSLFTSTSPWVEKLALTERIISKMVETKAPTVARMIENIASGGPVNRLEIKQAQREAADMAVAVKGLSDLTTKPGEKYNIIDPKEFARVFAEEKARIESPASVNNSTIIDFKRAARGLADKDIAKYKRIYEQTGLGPKDIEKLSPKARAEIQKVIGRESQLDQIMNTQPPPEVPSTRYVNRVSIKSFNEKGEATSINVQHDFDLSSLEITNLNRDLHNLRISMTALNKGKWKGSGKPETLEIDLLQRDPRTGELVLASKGSPIEIRNPKATQKLLDHFGSAVRGVKAGPISKGVWDFPKQGEINKGDLLPVIQDPSYKKALGSLLKSKAQKDSDSISVSKAIKTIADFMNVHLRRGKVTSRDAAAQYFALVGEARDRFPFRMETMTHELGHALHETFYGYGIRPKGRFMRQPTMLQQFADELEPLRAADYKDPRKWLSEGFAEFVKMFMTNPTKAKQYTPRFFEYFTKKISEYPALMKHISDFQRAVFNYSEGSPEARLHQVIAFKQTTLDTAKEAVADNPKGSIEKAFDAINQDWTDSMAYLEKINKALHGGKFKDVHDNFVNQLRAILGSKSGRVEAILKTTGVTDELGRPITRPMVKILAPVSENITDKTGWFVYAEAKRIQYKWPQFIKEGRVPERLSGLPKEDIDAIVTRLETPRYKAVLDEYIDFMRKLTKKCLEDQVQINTSADTLAMESMNEIYFPMFRVPDEGLARFSKSSGDMLPKQLRGAGSMKIQDPFEMINRQVSFYSMYGDKQEMMRLMANEAMKLPGGSRIMMEVPQKTRYVQARFEHFRKFLSKDIWEMLMEEGYDPATSKILYQVKANLASNEHLIYRKGKPYVYAIDDPMVLDAITDIVPYAPKGTVISWIWNLFNLSTKGIARGSTTYSPKFSIANPQRDVLQSMYQSATRNPFDTVRNIRRAIFSQFKEDVYFNEYNSQGISSAGITEILKSVTDVLKGATPEQANYMLNPLQIAWKYANKTVLAPVRYGLQGVRAASKFGETAGRTAHFIGMRDQSINDGIQAYIKKLGDTPELNKYTDVLRKDYNSMKLNDFLQKYDDIESSIKAIHKRGILEGTLAGRGSHPEGGSTDFWRSGKKGRQLNQISAFFNPGVQEIAQFGRLVRDHPVRQTIRGLSLITLPTMALWYANKDDPEYQVMSWWQRIFFWNFKPPGTNFFIPIPKFYLPALLWGSTFEEAANAMYKKDPYAMDKLGKGWQVISVPNVLPNAVNTLLMFGAGYDTFKMRSVLNTYEKQGKMPFEQYSPSTREFSKYIGYQTRNLADALQISPKLFEAKTKSLISSSGDSVLMLLDLLGYGANKAGLINQDFFKKAPNPMTLFSSAKHMYYNQTALDHFFDTYDDVSKAHTTINKSNKSSDVSDEMKENIEAEYGQMASWDTYFNNIAEQINAKMKLINSTEDEELKKIYGKEIDGLSENALETYKDGTVSNK